MSPSFPTMSLGSGYCVTFPADVIEATDSIPDLVNHIVVPSGPAVIDSGAAKVGGTSFSSASGVGALA